MWCFFFVKKRRFFFFFCEIGRSMAVNSQIKYFNISVCFFFVVVVVFILLFLLFSSFFLLGLIVLFPEFLTKNKQNENKTKQKQNKTKTKIQEMNCHNVATIIDSYSPSYYSIYHYYYHQKYCYHNNIFCLKFYCIFWTHGFLEFGHSYLGESCNNKIIIGFS